MFTSLLFILTMTKSKRKAELAADSDSQQCQRHLYCRHVTGRSRDVGYRSIEPSALIYPLLMLRRHVILSRVL